MSTETLNPETFDLIAFIEGSNYPEKVVTIYTNGKAALELRDLDPEKDKKRVAELRTEIEASGLHFTLRGLAPKIIEVMMKKADINSKGLSDEERIERLVDSTDSLVAATIQKVETADGRVDSQAWDTERAAQLRGVLIGSEYEKLAEAVNLVNFVAQLFADKADAGFPRGRTESGK